MAKVTIRALEGKIADLTASFLGLRDQRDNARAEAKEAQDIRDNVYAQFEDLKKRLHAAETANQFMRGYLARVQEDDVVREDLLTVGDPDGEQHMVPKRKPTEFKRPEDFTRQQSPDEYGLSYHERQNRKGNGRHWITY